MATLNQKTDEIAALETLKKDLANWEDKLKKATKKEVADKIKAKIADIKKQIKDGKTTDKEVSAKQLADSLLKSRKKFLEMSKKDFNGVVRQLAKRPEYAFLKGYTRQEIIDDIQRKAKPVGWRFKGRGNYKTPTPAQVRRGRALGTVYYENRPNRSDVSQTKQLAKGGGVDTFKVGDEVEFSVPYFESKFDYRGKIVELRGSYAVVEYYEPLNDKTLRTHLDLSRLSKRKMAKGGGVKGENLPFCIYVSNLNNPNANSELVAKVKKKGDALLITSELNKSLHKDTPLVYTMKEKKYEDGGNLEPMDEDDLPVVRYYFEDEAYEYANGGGLGKKGRYQILGASHYASNKKDVLYYSTDNKEEINKLVEKALDDWHNTRFDKSNSVTHIYVYDVKNDENVYDFAKGGNMASRGVHKVTEAGDDIADWAFNFDPKKKYNDGGDIDINDLNIPVHYTMFEDEMYEYAKGGGVERDRKINAALERKYANWEYPVPPVSTSRWTLKDWSNWIEKHGRKK